MKPPEHRVENKSKVVASGKTTPMENISLASVEVKKQHVAEKQAASQRQPLMPPPDIVTIPGRINDNEILEFLSKEVIDWRFVEFFKDVAGINYETISNWLNIDVKTLRNWKNPNYKLKPEDQEKVLLLMVLFKHGIDVFGSGEKFRQWLYLDNFYFGKKQPGSFLNTGTGIRFVDNNLTAIEYGDNA
jgi:uncharacterized protein (DUF2384 family)